MNKYCLVIPVYNHHHKLQQLLSDLQLYGLPVLLIDDGSEPQSAGKIAEMASQFDSVHLTVLPNNTGKGGAVMSGLKMASEQGFTHGIQIDADYQHNIKDLPEFIKQSEKHPEALICGVPEYDESVNSARYYARYLTHVWVWINTWSFDIKDSMCGFRSYPLRATVALIEQVKIGRHMNFDTEILVRLHWQQISIKNLPTAVIYHTDVPSNFRAFKDNVGISWMHTRLFFGMLVRIPQLISRKFRHGS